MLNQKYYPFERNRYFYGKLLTAKDFENEQKYVNDKRRLLNKMLNGTGVVCGLNTYAADEYSIIVDTGFALDSQGREIVVDETIIKKISTVDGFDKIEGETAYLGLEYQEEPSDLVYSPMSEEHREDEKQYNKIKEKYKITLENPENVVMPQIQSKDFIQENIIYEDEEVRLTQLTPRFANDKDLLKIKVVLEKKAGNVRDYSMEYAVELQGYTDKLEQSDLKVTIKQCTLNVGEKFIKEYILVPKDNLQDDVEFSIDFQSFKWQTPIESKDKLRKNLKILVQIRKDNVWNWIQEIYYKKSMDTQMTQTSGEKIWLAKITFIKSQDNCILDKIEPMPFKQYIISPAQIMLGHKIKEFYDAQHNLDIGELVAATAEPKVQEVSYPKMGNDFSTGYVDIPVALNANTKEPIFSDEIMHGLGKGSVYIDLGVEYVVENKGQSINSSEIIIGEASLFEERQVHPVKLEHAVKIFKDKGTFVIAIRLRENVASATIRMRWYAFKLPETQLTIKETQTGTLMLTPDTKVIKPHEAYTFKPVFLHMEAQPCSFTVLENDGGSINNMGVYTAPAKEGVYTIQAQVISQPELIATAFVVIKQEKE